MNQPDNITKLRAKIWQDIQKQGFSMMGVQAAESRANFAYTIGLYPPAPELIITGLSTDQMFTIFTALTAALKAGTLQIEPDAPYAAITAAPVYFIPVDREKYEEYAPLAVSWHRTREFPLYQVVWADEQGLYPWSPETTLREEEPLLNASRA